MLTIFLGFSASVVYGFADFFGGLATRKINAMMVTLVSGLSGLGFLLLISPWLGLKLESGSIFWGIMAGLFAAVAVTALYASLAIGPIAILSPLGAIVSALVPMGFGLFFKGETFTTAGTLALIGIVVAVGLVGFVPGSDVRQVCRNHSDRFRPRGCEGPLRLWPTSPGLVRFSPGSSLPREPRRQKVWCFRF